MFDIDHILGNKKQTKVKSKSFDLLGFNTRHFAVGDKITKPQRKIIKSNNWMKMWTDSDGDGVINALDCQPRNRKRHNAMFRQHLQNKYNIQLPNDEDRYMTNKYVHAFKRNPEVLSDAQGVKFLGRDEYLKTQAGQNFLEKEKNHYSIAGEYSSAPHTIMLTAPLFKKREYILPNHSYNKTIYHEIGHAKDKMRIVRNNAKMSKKQDEYMEYWNKLNHSHPDDIAEMKKRQQTLIAQASLKERETETYANDYAEKEVSAAKKLRNSPETPLPGNFDKPMEENTNV